MASEATPLLGGAPEAEALLEDKPIYYLGVWYVGHPGKSGDPVRIAWPREERRTLLIPQPLPPALSHPLHPLHH